MILFSSNDFASCVLLPLVHLSTFCGCFRIYIYAARISLMAFAYTPCEFVKRSVLSISRREREMLTLGRRLLNEGSGSLKRQGDKLGKRTNVVQENEHNHRHGKVQKEYDGAFATSTPFFRAVNFELYTPFNAMIAIPGTAIALGILGYFIFDIGSKTNTKTIEKRR